MYDIRVNVSIVGPVISHQLVLSGCPVQVCMIHTALSIHMACRLNSIGYPVLGQNCRGQVAAVDRA